MMIMTMRMMINMEKFVRIQKEVQNGS
jgi:hypothetical protein